MLADRGGWSAFEAGSLWLEHAHRVVRRCSGQGVLWVTFNEPRYYTGLDTVHGLKSPLDTRKMQRALVDTHRRAYDLIHSLDPGALVTSNLAHTPPPMPQEDLRFVDQVRDKLDYLGVDYYYGLSLDNLTGVFSFLGHWVIRPQPDGLYEALLMYSRRYPELPLYIVEDGMATDNGKPRTYPLHAGRLHPGPRLLGPAGDRRRGRVIGYNYWSLVDSYEWGNYRARFGLYRVDVKNDPTLQRRETDGVGAYREVIDVGGAPGGYAPTMRPAFCSFANLPDTCTLERLLGRPT